MRVTIPTIEELLATLTPEERERFASDLFLRGTAWLRFERLVVFEGPGVRWENRVRVPGAFKVMEVE